MSSSRGTRDARNRLFQRAARLTPAGLYANTGPLATAAWLVERELFPREPRWFVEIALGIGHEPPAFDRQDGTRFHLELFAEEWGFLFCHDDRTSWIRVTDVPFVHGRDEHKLLHRTPPLTGVGKLLRSIEQQHGLAFARAHAAVRTNIGDGEPAVRTWLAAL